MLCMFLCPVMDIACQMYLFKTTEYEIDDIYYKRDHLTFTILWLIPTILVKFTIVININTWCVYYWKIAETEAQALNKNPNFSGYEKLTNLSAAFLAITVIMIDVNDIIN